MSKVVIVTGARGGVGSATLRRLVERSGNVIAVNWTPHGMEQLCELGGEMVTAAVADVEDAQRYVAQAVDRFAASTVSSRSPASGRKSTSPSNEAYDEVVRVDAQGVWLGMKYTLPHLVGRGGGSVVTTARTSRARPRRPFRADCVSKHAVVGMTNRGCAEYGVQNASSALLHLVIRCDGRVSAAAGEKGSVAELSRSLIDFLRTRKPRRTE